MLMATSGARITCNFSLLLCFIFKFSKMNIYYLHYKNTLYPCRDWVTLSLRWFREYLGRDVSWKSLPSLCLSDRFPYECFFSMARPWNDNLLCRPSWPSVVYKAGDNNKCDLERIPKQSFKPAVLLHSVEWSCERKTLLASLKLPKWDDARHLPGLSFPALLSLSITSHLFPSSPIRTHSTCCLCAVSPMPNSRW